MSIFLFIVYRVVYKTIAILSFGITKMLWQNYLLYLKGMINMSFLVIELDGWIINWTEPIVCLCGFVCDYVCLLLMIVCDCL